MSKKSKQSRGVVGDTPIKPKKPKKGTPNKVGDRGVGIKSKQKKDDKLRIIWTSNAVHTNSGYAVQSRDVLFRLIKEGFNIASVGFFGTEGYYQFLDGGDLIDERFEGLKLKVYPKMADPYGGDAMVNHAMDYGAHVVFNMQDIWTINTQFLKALKDKKINWIPWLPIDQEPPHKNVLQNLNFADKIITYSRFGQRVLEDEGFASRLILEGTDTKIFKPMDKDKLRKKFNLPQDAFLFGMIGANKENPPRKGYQEALDAFKLFLDNHPEGAIFFHTQQVAPGGFPILDYARHIKIADRVFIVDQYSASFRADSHQIAKEINTFDCLLHPSQTEGFGLLIIEAQSCGVPVIVNDCHSQPELVIEGKTGEVSKTDKPWFRSLGGYVYPANVKSLHEKMEKIYKKMTNEEKRSKMKSAARKHIEKNYDIDKIVKEKWIPLLNELSSEYLG